MTINIGKILERERATRHSCPECGNPLYSDNDIIFCNTGECTFAGCVETYLAAAGAPAVYGKYARPKRKKKQR